jgi:hypothetical protein
VTPDTIHLLAQFIRHHRALVTTVENWTKKQPPSETRRELMLIIAVARGVLDSYEQQLSHTEVTPVTRSESIRSGR